MFKVAGGRVNHLAAFIVAVTALSTFDTRASGRVTVAWDPNPETNITHYHVLYGTASRSYPLRQTVQGLTSTTISNLQSGVTYYFAVTAENSHGLESDPSVELSYQVPATPLNLPPVPGADEVTSPEDAILSIPAAQLLANDADPNPGDTLTVIAAGPQSSAGGAVALTGASVQFTPMTNFFGTDAFTYVIRDPGGLLATGQVSVAVSPVNDRPTISALGNRTINEDTTTGAISFTVADVDHSAAALTVSGASSNSALVPPANIVFGGSGSARTVSVSPAPDQSGFATITVTVSDGSLTASSSFVLTVQPVNDAPVVFAGADATVTLPASLSLNGSVSDDGQPAVPGSWTAQWSATSGPGAATFASPTSPATLVSFSAAGTYILKLTASDGQLSSSDELTVVVAPVVDTTGPVVSGLAVAFRDARTIGLTWVTDETSTSQVEYGLTDNLGLVTPLETGLSAEHLAELAGLLPDSTYFVRVRSTDPAGNESVTGIFSAVTPAISVLSWPAESGDVVTPMARVTDPTALDGIALNSPTAGQGSVAFPVQVPVESSYVLWCRVRSGTAGIGSFRVTLDQDEEVPFDIGEEGWREGWRWVAVTGRSGPLPTSVDPRRFLLGTNLHVFRLIVDEAGHQLDELVLSNDPQWAPGITGTAPIIAAAALSADRISLQWTDTLADEDGFALEWSADGTVFEPLAVTPAGVTGHEHSGLLPGTINHYRVYGFNQTDRTDYSNVISARTTPAVPPPAAPQSLTATLVKRGKVRLNWQDRSNNELGFLLERSTDGVTFSPLKTLAPNVQSTTDVPPGIKNGQTFHYRVSAFNDGGASAPSNVAVVRSN
ncbi:MAG TPA: hypothetical protein DCY13_16665 [Verrucomicrobiales bacterium]|nr:hypothetical protein [Verrucomicrobiales bacterium]